MAENSGKRPKKDKELAKKTSDPGDIESRRQAVRRILIGSGVLAGSQVLPKEWTKPVVKSVITPAHAVTSLTDPCGVTITSGDQSSATVVVRVDGVLSAPVGGVNVTILVQAFGGSNDTAGPFIEVTAPDGSYSRDNIQLNGPGITSVQATVSIPGDTDVCSAVVPGGTTTTNGASTTTGIATSTTTGISTSTTTSVASTTTATFTTTTTTAA